MHQIKCGIDIFKTHGMGDKGASWISPCMACSTIPGSCERPLPQNAEPNQRRPVTGWNGRVAIS